MLLWVAPKPDRILKARASGLAWSQLATSKGPRAVPVRRAHFCFLVEILDFKGFVPLVFRYLPKARMEIDVEANPSYLSSQLNFVPADGTFQEVQKAAEAHCDEWCCFRFQTKKKIIDVQPSAVLDEKELVEEAYEHCSHAAPPCSAEARPKVAHCVVVEFASMLE